MESYYAPKERRRSFDARRASGPPLIFASYGCIVTDAVLGLGWLMTTLASGSNRQAAFAMSLGAGSACMHMHSTHMAMQA